MISDFVLSLIRTYLPIAVGSALVWAAAQTDIVIEPDSANGVIAVAVALVSGAYYLVARWLEGRWPWLSILLGTPPKVSTPTYREVE